MKRFASLVGIVMLLVCLMGAVLETNRFVWNAGTAVSTDDTLLSASATTMQYADIPTTNVFKADEKINAIEVSWTMGAGGQACVCWIFAARANGDIVPVWTGTLECTAANLEYVSTGSLYYVDSITATTSYWPTSIAEVCTSGADYTSRIFLDTCGYKYFIFQYTGLSSESVKQYVSGY